MRLRDRRLFKTTRLRPEVPREQAQERLFEAVRAAGHDPAYYAMVDRVEVSAYEEDDAMTVLSGSRNRSLLEASHMLRGLSRERYVHYRAVFPPGAREAVARALADLQ